MATMKFFAQAKDVAECSSASVDGKSLDLVVGAVVSEYGKPMQDVIDQSQIWVNGKEATSASQPLVASDEVAIIPPVSGG